MNQRRQPWAWFQRSSNTPLVLSRRNTKPAHWIDASIHAVELSVNAIEPGAIFTKRQRALWYPTEADVDALVSQQILKRAMDGGDIARMALFLASDDARIITKQSFIVDAGLL